MLGEDDLVEDNEREAVAAAAVDGTVGEAGLANSEQGAEVLEHGRVIEYVVPKLEGKLPSAAKLGEIAADIVNDNWSDNNGLIKFASAQTQYLERSKEMVPRGMARYIRQPFNNVWEVPKFKEGNDGVLRLTAMKPEAFMNMHEKTTLGVLLKGSNQGAMVIYILNVLMCACEGNLNVFQNWGGAVRRQAGVQRGSGRGRGVEAAVAGLWALGAPSHISQSVVLDSDLSLRLMQGNGGSRATPSPSRGGSDGPELVGCVSCALCAV